MAEIGRLNKISKTYKTYRTKCHWYNILHDIREAGLVKPSAHMDSIWIRKPAYADDTQACLSRRVDAIHDCVVGILDPRVRKWAS